MLKMDNLEAAQLGNYALRICKIDLKWKLIILHKKCSNETHNSFNAVSASKFGIEFVNELP